MGLAPSLGVQRQHLCDQIGGLSNGPFLADLRSLWDYDELELRPHPGASQPASKRNPAHRAQAPMSREQDVYRSEGLAQQEKIVGVCHG